MSNESLASILTDIHQMLADDKARRDTPDVWIQWPTSDLDELFPAKTTRTIVKKRVARRLKTVNVCVPEGTKITLYSDGIQQAYFHDVSGCFDFPNGIFFGDVEITISNLTETDKRISYNFIFTA